MNVTPLFVLHLLGHFNPRVFDPLSAQLALPLLPVPAAGGSGVSGAEAGGAGAVHQGKPSCGNV